MQAPTLRWKTLLPMKMWLLPYLILGYIKRTPLAEYRLQSRGGRGAKAAEARDEDFLEHMFTATNHNYLLFFTKQGKCYWMRAFEVPEGAKASKGRAIQNLLKHCTG